MIAGRTALGAGLRGWLLIAFLWSAAAGAAPLPSSSHAPGTFDFYVLSLSWSPSYCAAEGDHANRHQCGPGRPFAFVVHGLWPQYEHGYPQRCSSSDPDRVPDAVVAQYLDLMPSAGLIGYQWRKHGACTGLGQTDYFARVRAARGKVAVPPEFQNLQAPKTVAPAQVEQAFLKSNPGLSSDGIAVTCDKRYLREVRICLTKDLSFRSCREVDSSACHADKMAMPPNRVSPAKQTEQPE